MFLIFWLLFLLAVGIGSYQYAKWQDQRQSPVSKENGT